MSDKDKNVSDKFNKAAKGAAIGAGAAVVIGAVTILPVSLPVIAVGAAIGGFLGYKRGK